jgi:hypothetical protein
VLTDVDWPEFDAQDKAITIPAEPRIRRRGLEEHLLRGRALYMALQCVNCHGSEGRGDGPGWNTTLKDNGGLIRPRDFRARDAGDQPALRLRGGASPQDLYRTIFTGLQGTGMKSSFDDFRPAWQAAARVQELIEAGAPEAEIQAAREAARRKLYFPLNEELPGVIEVEEDGQRVQYIEQLEEGDDWALVHYVMWLSGIEIPTVR